MFKFFPFMSVDVILSKLCLDMTQKPQLADITCR